MKRLIHQFLQQARRLAPGERLRRAGTALRELLRGDGAGSAAPSPTQRAPSGADGVAPDAGPGDFLEGEHAGPEGSRRYRLYLPPGPAATPRPLLVMLHGCQ